MGLLKQDRADLRATHKSERVALKDASTTLSDAIQQKTERAVLLVFAYDKHRDLHDPDGHLSNSVGQKLYAQGAVISYKKMVSGNGTKTLYTKILSLLLKSNNC